MSKSIGSAVLLLLLIAPAAPALAEGSDDLWEISTSMSMGGMQMPPHNVRQCVAKGGSYQPSSERNCQVTSYKVVGNKAVWDVKCTGTEAMTGHGEMTRTSDAMNGTVTITSDKAQMTQTMAGKRVGTCDAGKEQQKREAMVADAKAQGEAATQQACEERVKSDAATGGVGKSGADMYHGQGMCAAYQPKLCAAARENVAGYSGYANWREQKSAPTSQQIGWGWVLDECQIDLERQRVALCQRSVTDQNYAFTAGNCPAETKSLNEKYCAGFGMDYTADMARPNAKMCTALRGGGAPAVDAGAAVQPAAKADPKAAGAESADKSKTSDSPAGKALDAAKKLKGVLGF